MNKLKVVLQNCYGIHSLSHEFDFDTGINQEKKQSRAYAIYAPNGLMKSSFAKTFEDVGNGIEPKEERYSRVSECSITLDGFPIIKENIYVLKSEIDIGLDSPAMTDILVNPEKKARYDELLVGLEKHKVKLIGALQKKSKIKKGDVERVMLADLEEISLPACIQKLSEHPCLDDLTPYEYATIFDPRSLEVLKSNEFISKAHEFSKRYQDLFTKVGSIYKRGVFNPVRAETSFSTLDKQGFFAGGHRVHLSGEEASIDKKELDEKLSQIHAEIDGDIELKKLRSSLARNVQTQALNELIESRSPSEVEFLLDKLKPECQFEFRKDLWAFYIKNTPEALVYMSSYADSKNEIELIEAAASQEAPQWAAAVERFNDRFVDMPFTLSVSNQAQASLGKENARLMFLFKDGEDEARYLRSEIKTLSQGEKRALYLLNFIFEVEARKLAKKNTVFIIDDAADSFDYKNKHAIVQYLNDLCSVDFFSQIILTHNFDFFRALALNFVSRERCLMANRGKNKIGLFKADGISNIFIKKWKGQIDKNDVILCASIPFTRNIVEYTTDSSSADYLQLTSLLHWKKDTDGITVGDYIKIYNRVFSKNICSDSKKPVKDLLFEKADEISVSSNHDGLNLEDKVLLSIAIRLSSEIYITRKLREYMGDPDYWCPSKSQFGSLMKEISTKLPGLAQLRTLEKVSITVSSNIHLNSFMYEPILDLTIEHLVSLYKEVRKIEGT